MAWDWCWCLGQTWVSEVIFVVVIRMWIGLDDVGLVLVLVTEMG